MLKFGIFWERRRTNNPLKFFLLTLIFFSFFYLSPFKTLAATGDITAVRIVNEIDSYTEAYSGWVAEIDIDGLSTGGTYNFGLGTNNDPTNAKIIFNVTSQGYDNSGNATTMTRTVYGTNYLRKIYPNDAEAYETDNSGSITVRVALSEYIYSSDTVTVSIASGFYSQGGNNSGTVSNLAVTNNSDESYPKVIANWSWPGYSRITGDTLTLRAVAFHRSAQDGKPVKAVKFTCTDEHSNTASSIITSPTISNPDSSAPDAIPIIEYVGTINTTSFTNLDTLTCNFIAYPWYGDSGSLLNTGDGVNTMPTPLYAPQYYLVDRANTYGVSVAVVDPVSGNDSNNCAAQAPLDTENPPLSCLTIAGAANDIADLNATIGSMHNDVGGSVIYLKEGNYSWPGATVNTDAKALAKTWVTITKYPGATRSNVNINNRTAQAQIGELLKFEDITIANGAVQAMNFYIYGMDFVWIHNSNIGDAPYNNDTATLNTITSNKILYVTNNNIWKIIFSNAGSLAGTSLGLLRGNASQQYLIKAFRPYTALGNDLDLYGSSAMFSPEYVSQFAPFNNVIYCYNFLSKLENTSYMILLHGSNVAYGQANSFGGAIVQNILETASNSLILALAADGTTNDPVNNFLIWNNTTVGQRINIAYNDNLLEGIGPVYRKHWSIKNNIFDDTNFVTDKDLHNGSPNSDGYGNHSLVHGVGMSGNFVLGRVGSPSYEPKFHGLLSYDAHPGTADPLFVNDNSTATDSTGNGDYHLTASSPMLSFVADGSSVLPYDIEGNPRYNNGYGAAGAYEFDVTVAPTVSTADSVATSITQTSAVLNGSITNNGASDATQSGFAWGTSSTLTTDTATTTLGAQVGAVSFTDSSLSSLVCGTTYYARAYATNSAGTGFGAIQSFSTSACPDTTPPTPGSVDFSNVTTTSITVSSTDATDETALAANPYQYRNITDNTYSTLTNSSWNFTSLTPNTSYSFEVGVVDESGNWATSTPADTSTLAVTTTSPVVYNRPGERSYSRPATPNVTSTFARDLSVGANGVDVRTLQELLIAKNYLASGYNTGYFGFLTRDALIQYQKANNINPALGHFGPITKTLISSTSANLSPIPLTNLNTQIIVTTNPATTPPHILTTSLSFGQTNAEVIILQRFLNTDPETRVAQTGIGSPGNETSYFGSLTLDAVKRFQIKYNIAKQGDLGFGNVGPKTRMKLNELY